MHLIIERRGGFAGLAARGELSDADMTSAQRQSLERLLASPPAPAPAPGADRFTYHLTIERDGVSHQMAVPETALPDELKQVAKLHL